jgi:hypothetical protein
MTADNEPVFLRMRKGTGLWVDTSGYWTYPAFIESPDGGNLLWLSLVLKTAPMPDKKRTALFRPMAEVITRANTGMVLRYDNFRLGHDPFPTVSWEKPIAMFPHKGIARLTYADFQKKEEGLLGAYAGAGERFQKKGELTKAFSAQFLKITHPIVLPYLKHLAPDFFNALGVESNEKEVLYGHEQTDEEC